MYSIIGVGITCTELASGRRNAGAGDKYWEFERVTRIIGDGRAATFFVFTAGGLVGVVFAFRFLARFIIELD